MYPTIITPTFKLDVNYIKKLLLMLKTWSSRTTIHLDDELTEEQVHDYIQALLLQTLSQSRIIDISENSSWNYSINSNIPYLIS